MSKEGYVSENELDNPSLFIVKPGWAAISSANVTVSNGGQVLPWGGAVELVTGKSNGDYVGYYVEVDLPYDTSLVKRIRLLFDVVYLGQDDHSIVTFGINKYCSFPLNDSDEGFQWQIGTDRKLYIMTSDGTHYEKIDTGIIVPGSGLPGGIYILDIIPLVSCDFYYNWAKLGTLKTYIPQVIYVMPWLSIVTTESTDKNVYFGRLIEEIRR